MSDPTAPPPPPIQVTIAGQPMTWPQVAHGALTLVLALAVILLKFNGYQVTPPSTAPTPTTTATATGGDPAERPGVPPDVATLLGAVDPAQADPPVPLPMKAADGRTVLVWGHWYPSHAGKPARGVIAYQEDNEHLPNLRALIEGPAR